MKRSLKVTIVLSFVALATFVLTTRSLANLHSAAYQTRISRAPSAKDIYLQNCARCHGVDGRGDTEQGRKYDVPDLGKEAPGASPAKWTRIITNGRDDMPAFGKKLTKKQITSLTAFVRKL